MNDSLERQADFERGSSAGVLAPNVLAGSVRGARGSVVNRTHRVVRHRAALMQERRSYLRSLMLPLAICSALLVLTIFAVWSGLYQYQASDAVGAVQADVVALASSDMMDHMMVLLLWFVPVSLTVLAIVWFRRMRNGADYRMTR